MSCHGIRGRLPRLSSRFLNSTLPLRSPDALSSSALLLRGRAVVFLPGQECFDSPGPVKLSIQYYAGRSQQNHQFVRDVAREKLFLRLDAPESRKRAKSDSTLDVTSPFGTFSLDSP